MSSLAHPVAAPEARGRAVPSIHAPARLRLLPTGDGWSLVGPDGRLVFQALGWSARQQCLEFARAHGVLAIFS